MINKDLLKLSIAQIAPCWMSRDKTIQKVVSYIEQAGRKKADLVVFGEAIVPGYPFWLDRMNGAEFNSLIQKEIHSLYVDQAVCIEKGHLDPVCEVAKSNKIAVYLGIIERPLDRGGHSLYCSLVFIDFYGEIKSVHRKLMPTYEERLAWSTGDGHGLVTHSLKEFTVGGLNCWENWMPLARTALYARGEDLHVSVWPGNKRNTEKLLPVIAMESRSFVVGACGLFRSEDITDDFPNAPKMMENVNNILADGGSCLVSPTGEWIIEPQTGKEKLLFTEIDHGIVRQERQNFDPVGHYSRPDVLKLEVNRERQGY